MLRPTLPRYIHIVQIQIKPINLLSGLAAGRWILTRDFVDDSYDQGRWARPQNYIHDEVRFVVVVGEKSKKIFWISDHLDVFKIHSRVKSPTGGRV